MIDVRALGKVVLIAAVLVAGWIAETWALQWLIGAVHDWWSMVPVIDFGPASVIVILLDLFVSAGSGATKLVKKVAEL